MLGSLFVKHNNTHLQRLHSKAELTKVPAAADGDSLVAASANDHAAYAILNAAMTNPMTYLIKSRETYDDHV
jgi:hypothetical protein